MITWASKGAALGRVVLRVAGHVAALDVLDGEVLHVEADVVAGHGLGEGLVVHLDGLHLGGEAGGGEGHDHAGLDHAGLDAAHGDGADTADLVHVLEGQAEGLVHGALRRVEVVERLEEVGSLVPRHVGGLVDHVVALPAGDGDERDLLGLVADLLQVARHLGLDLVVAGLAVLDGFVVHLVDGHDHLLDAEGEGEQRVLAGLAVLGDAGLEATLHGSMTSTATSACEVPVIMFLMKSRWPGASITVKWNLSVSNFQRAMSMVIPRSRSALRLSSTQAYLKKMVPCPISAASFSNFSMVRLSGGEAEVGTGAGGGGELVRARLRFERWRRPREPGNARGAAKRRNFLRGIARGCPGVSADGCARAAHHCAGGGGGRGRTTGAGEKAYLKTTVESVGEGWIDRPKVH